MDAALYQDGAWGTGTNVFQVAVPVNATATYAARVYVGDSYNNWPNITLRIEGNPAVVNVDTTAHPFWSYLLGGGADANGDGLLTITVDGPVWVINGIDVKPGTTAGLPASAGPAGSPQLAAGGAVAGGKTPTLTADQLAPVVAEAVARWEAAGVTPDQLAALKGVRYEITDLNATDHLGLTEVNGGVVQLDDDGDGRGWFVDATPADDSEFGTAVGGAELAAKDGPAAAGYDLLTVVMHELGHVIGLDSIDPAVAPHDLMTATLSTGTRRLAVPADGPVALGAPAATEVTAGTPTDVVSGSKDVAVATDVTVPAGDTNSGASAFAPLLFAAPAKRADGWFADDALLGIEVG
jgi:hypothetical protein